MPTLNPWINFNGNAEEAFNFYQSVFGGEFVKLTRFKDIATPEYPVEDADAEKIMNITLQIGDGQFLIGNLSPGGRARLLLAIFAATAVNALLLDEPTNHLDLEALEALEEALETYQGTVILVSHDRYFLETAKLDLVYVLSDGVFTKIPDYTVYVKEAEARAEKLLRSL